MTENTICEVEDWIKEYVKSAHAKGVVVGMSGGKDSLVTAKLCADALGKENVLGIILPNGKMKDIADALEACKLVGIRCYEANISGAVDSILEETKKVLIEEGTTASTVTTTNVPPRVRMTMLYAIASSLNFLVANTSNLSEAMVGYTTKWGDNVGDFSPLGSFTKTEVCEIGIALGLPEHLVNKTPDDGLSGKSDEENLGVTYEEIDRYIRTGESKDSEKILALAKKSFHKRNGVAKFENGKPNFLTKK